MFIEWIVKICTKNELIMNKMCPKMQIVAGYTNFSPRFFHNVHRKKLAIIGIVQ